MEPGSGKRQQPEQTRQHGLCSCLPAQGARIKLNASPRLTDAQAQLAATNDAYEVAKTQLDTLRGIDASVLTVAEAIEAFQVACTGEATARQKLLAKSTMVESVSGREQAVADIDPTNIAASVRWATAQLANVQAMVAQGGNLSFQAAEVSALKAYLLNPLTQNIPAYATGTNYVPKDGPAYLHQGEAVIPKAYNPAAGGNSRTDALLEGLTKEVQRLQSIVNDGNKSNERIAIAVNGNPDRPVLVEIA